MAYITFVNLGHNLCCFILANLSLFYSINVLFRKSVLKKSVNISPTITVYFGFIFIWAILSIFYFGYLLFLWRPNDGIYDAYLLFFTGVGPGLFLTTNSIAETFLCIERCISLLFPLKYSKNEKFWFAIGTILSLIALFGIVTYCNNYIFYFPKDSETNCQFFGCLLGKSNKYMLYAKILFNIINIFFAILLAILIKYTLTTNSKNTKQMNKTVAILIASTTVMELFPFGIGQAFVLIYGQQLFLFAGSYGTTAISINITLSAAIYFKAFKKSLKTIHSSKVTFIGTTNTLPAAGNK